MTELRLAYFTQGVGRTVQTGDLAAIPKPTGTIRVLATPEEI